MSTAEQLKGLDPASQVGVIANQLDQLQQSVLERPAYKKPFTITQLARDHEMSEMAFMRKIKPFNPKISEVGKVRYIQESEWLRVLVDMT